MHFLLAWQDEYNEHQRVIEANRSHSTMVCCEESTHLYSGATVQYRRTLWVVGHIFRYTYFLFTFHHSLPANDAFHALNVATPTNFRCITHNRVIIMGRSIYSIHMHHPSSRGRIRRKNAKPVMPIFIPQARDPPP